MYGLVFWDPQFTIFLCNVTFQLSSNMGAEHHYVKTVTHNHNSENNRMGLCVLM